MNEKKFIILLIVLLTVGAGCQFGNASQGGFSMTTEEALVLWQAGKAVIIDVRTQKEYEEGHIPDVALIPIDQLENRLDDMSQDRQVLLICHSGRRSAMGTNWLRSKGFEQVYNIEGGMLAWHGPVVK